jgi:hypothetical protein
LLALPRHFHEEGDCAWVPDAAPTGKTLEAVKERFCFYAFYFFSQRKICVCNQLVFSGVQAVHRRVTKIGAAVLPKFMKKPERACESSV